ncbi:hypothetical protein KAJ27_19525 [bacterium]|nr:hypothetical protein [bacterium]
MSYKNGGIFFGFFILVYYFTRNSIFKMIKSALKQLTDFLLEEPVPNSSVKIEEGKKIDSEK